MKLCVVAAGWTASLLTAFALAALPAPASAQTPGTGASPPAARAVPSANPAPPGASGTVAPGGDPHAVPVPGAGTGSYLGQERVKARQQRQPPPKDEKKVDLNNASIAELKTLPAVGDAEARRIVAHRPYVSKVDLVSRAGLPEGVYLAVRHHTVVGAPKKAADKNK